MLKLPGDEFVTIELVHNPSETDVDGGTRLSHFVIQVTHEGARYSGAVLARRADVWPGWSLDQGFREAGPPSIAPQQVHLRNPLEAACRHELRVVTDQVPLVGCWASRWTARPIALTVVSTLGQM